MAVKEITERIAEYDFFVITTRLRRDLRAHERIGNVEVFRVGSGKIPILDKILSTFLGAILARRLMKKYNVRVFWSMMVTFTSGAPFLLKVFRLNKNIPILLTLQEGDSEAHLKFSNFGLTGLAWFFAMRMADRIQTISGYLKGFARRMGAKQEIAVVPNGVDLTKFKNQNSKIKMTNQNSKIVITTSRLVKKNGIDTLIKAIAEVKKEIPDIKLWILGGGEQAAELNSLAEHLGIKSSVKFFGEIPNDEVYDYLGQADIFVRPSRSEGLGTSFLEAMAVGLPIVATSVGGIPDFLKDGQTGLFCKKDDPSDLAEKISQLFHDADLRKKVAQRGQELVLRDYSWDSVALRVKGIFDKMTV